MAKSRNICESSFDTRNTQPLTTVGHHKQKTEININHIHLTSLYFVESWSLLMEIPSFAGEIPVFAAENPQTYDVTRCADIHLGHHEPHCCAALRSVKWFIIRILKYHFKVMYIYNGQNGTQTYIRRPRQTQGGAR